MKNTFFALAAAATLAAALPSSAQANCGGCGVAAGVVGGLAAGAIIGSAIANSRPAYVPNGAKCGTGTLTAYVASKSATKTTRYRRMCSSTAAVGQQSTFRPFFF